MKIIERDTLNAQFVKVNNLKALLTDCNFKKFVFHHQVLSLRYVYSIAKNIIKSEGS